MAVRKISENLTLLLVGFFLIFASCNKKQDHYRADANDSIVIVEELPNKKDYTVFSYNQKKMVVSDAKMELDSFNLAIESLKKTYEEKETALSKEDAVSFKDATTKLEKERDNYKNLIKALEDSRPEKWDSLKTDVVNAYNIVLQSIDNLENNNWSQVSDSTQLSSETAEKVKSDKMSGDKNDTISAKKRRILREVKPLEIAR